MAKKEYEVIQNGLVFTNGIDAVPNVVGHTSKLGSSSLTLTPKKEKLKNLIEHYCAVMKAQLLQNNASSQVQNFLNNLDNEKFLQLLSEFESLYADEFNYVAWQYTQSKSASSLYANIREGIKNIAFQDNASMADKGNKQAIWSLFHLVKIMAEISNSPEAENALALIKQVRDNPQQVFTCKFSELVGVTQIYETIIKAANKEYKNASMSAIFTQSAETLINFLDAHVDQAEGKAMEQLSEALKRNIGAIESTVQTRIGKMTKQKPADIQSKNGITVRQKITENAYENIVFVPYLSVKTYEHLDSSLQLINSKQSNLQKMFEKIFGWNDREKFVYYNTVGHANSGKYEAITKSWQDIRKNVIYYFGSELFAGWDQNRLTSILVYNSKAYSILAILGAVFQNLQVEDNKWSNLYELKFSPSDKKDLTKPWWDTPGVNPKRNSNARKWQRINQVIKKGNQISVFGKFNVQFYEQLLQEKIGEMRKAQVGVIP